MRTRTAFALALLALGALAGDSIPLAHAEVVHRAERAATLTPYSAKTADFDVLAALASRRLVGLSIRESAGSSAAATVVLRHAVLATGACSGDAIAYLELAADTSQQVQFGSRGVAVASGVCADVLAGTVDLTAFSVIEPSP